MGKKLERGNYTIRNENFKVLYSLQASFYDTQQKSDLPYNPFVFEIGYLYVRKSKKNRQ